MFGTLVVGTRPPEHEHAAVELHVHVRGSSLFVGPAAGFLEAERLGDPIGGTSGVLVGQHRHHTLLRHTHPPPCSDLSRVDYSTVPKRRGRLAAPSAGEHVEGVSARPPAACRRWDCCPRSRPARRSGLTRSRKRTRSPSRPSRPRCREPTGLPAPPCRCPPPRLPGSAQPPAARAGSPSSRRTRPWSRRRRVQSALPEQLPAL